MSTKLEARLIYDDKGIETNEGITNAIWELETIFGVSENIQQINRRTRFLSRLKTSDYQEILFTSLDDYMTVTINSSSMFVCTFISSAEMPSKINEAIIEYLTFFRGSWLLQGSNLKMIENIADIGSVASFNY